MPPKSSWRDRLYSCKRVDFPQFARLRLIYQELRVSKDEFHSQIDFPKGKQTLKAILDGKVRDNKHYSKGVSVIDDPVIVRAVASLKRLGYEIQIDDLTRRMSEQDFVARLGAVFARRDEMTAAHVTPAAQPARAGRSDSAGPKYGRVPIFLSDLTPWNLYGNELMKQIESWIADGAFSTRHLGIAGPSGCGKTALVSTCLRKAGLENRALWFDCSQFETYELIIDGFLDAILAFPGDHELETRKAGIDAKIEWILAHLRKQPVTVVFDAVESLFERLGQLTETTKDPMIEAFITRVMAGARTIIVSQEPRPLLSEVAWLTTDTTLYDAMRIASSRMPAQPGGAPVDLAPVAPARPILEQDVFPAVQVFDNILDLLDQQQTDLFVFITLIGEEVRKSTILWYVVEHLGIDPREQQGFLDRFWTQCAIAGAKVVQIVARVFDDKLDDPTALDNLLHYKFHESIATTALRHFAGAPEQYRIRRVHRRIAERARSMMHLLHEKKEHYAGRNVVGRFTRPAQVIKHLLAAMDERPSLPERHDAAPELVGPLDLEAVDTGEEHWKDVWAGTAGADRVYQYCFAEIYRRYIDRTRKHDLSHVHGADRAKVNLLIRFLFPGRSDHAEFDFQQATLPRLPVNLLCDLLNGLAVAGLNCGALEEATWAIDRSLDVLSRWKASGLQPLSEYRSMLAFITRVQADVLIRRGDLARGHQICEAALDDDSPFMEAATPAEQDKLRIRHGNIIFMMEGIGPAIEYMESIGLMVPDTNALSGFSPIDLTGLSGRLWVTLLLRTMRGRRPAQQLAILDQALMVHKENYDRWKGRSNEQIALHVEKSILDRISRQAITMRRPDIVDDAALPGCARLLQETRLLAWKRGVSPTTRMELDIESAKVLYLQGNSEGALALLDENLRIARSFGYRCYEYDILVLKAEIIWAAGRVEEAEASFDRLIDLEQSTGYKAAHALRLWIQTGALPTRIFPG